MSDRARVGGEPRLRIGGVAYLNSQPLICCLPRLAPEAQLVLDLPSRLADALAAAELDVALIPSVESFCHPEYTIVSDACVSCEGPVRSVKLYSRVPAAEIRTLALDEGSRTSAALVRILLKERFGLEPELRRLPVGTPLEQSRADATMLIGDRGMRPARQPFALEWDLGEEWSRWSGLPFVFALWIARPGVDCQRLGALLSAARDEGLERLEEIARVQAPRTHIPQSECLAYLRDHLQFRLGDRQCQGLERFRGLVQRHGLVPGAQEPSV